MKSDTIFIAWNQISRRSEEFSRKIGAEYINLGRVDKPLIMRLLNLLKNFFKTYIILHKRKPHIIFTFHAHPFITLVAIIYKLTNRCKVVPDLHSAAYLDYCLLYTSDAADDSLRVDLGGRRIIKKK